MHLSTLFSRAWQQKYLTPAERAVYKFVVALIVLIPSSALLGGLNALLSWLNMSVPGWLWQGLIVLIPALLLALAKYATAQGDTAVGAIIQQVEGEAVQGIAGSKITSLGTSANAPAPIPLRNVPPRASAPQQPPA